MLKVLNVFMKRCYNKAVFFSAEGSEAAKWLAF